MNNNAFLPKMTTTINEVLHFLEQWAPMAWQENYDNAGLIVGNRMATVTGAMIALDATEAVIDEAIAKNCNLVIAHHPIVFKGLKSLTGKNYVERTVLKAIKNEVAIYAIHTNLDNIHTGVNAKICQLIGLKNCQILEPKNQILLQLTAYCPTPQVLDLSKAIAQMFGTTEPIFSEAKTTTNLGESVPITKIETVVPQYQQNTITRFFEPTQPGYGIAYSLVPLQNAHPLVGSGMIGQLPTALNPQQFLSHLKQTLKASCVRYTAPTHQLIETVAVCGGAGHFLLPQAIAQKAQVFVSADFKYHEFFDADNRIMIADIGHYESEQFTGNLILEQLTQKFANFACFLTSVQTNPIHYY